MGRKGNRMVISSRNVTDAIEAGARAIYAKCGEYPNYTLRHVNDLLAADMAKACIEAAIASGALVPASAVAEMRERCRIAVTELDCMYVEQDGVTSRYEYAGIPADPESAIRRETIQQCEAAIRQLDTAPACGEYVVVPASPMSDIAAERKRQCEVEGWSPDHDDTHVSGEMAMAAACYTLASFLNTEHALNTTFTRYWPWDRKWWKPKSPRENLIRAAALIVAEIERQDRTMLTASTIQGG